MTDTLPLLRITGMNKRIFAIGAMLAMLAGMALGQKDKKEEEEPTSWLNFIVVKDDNGKPVRNAAVIMHPVNATGRQARGGTELKTSAEGKADFDGIPYGMLRVQVLAQGFQTYGEDFDVEKPKMEITIKLKRPQQQFSVYKDHPKDSNPPPKQDAPQDQKDQKDQKPN
jgi:Carboxypeptidase regulatory-like domain